RSNRRALDYISHLSALRLYLESIAFDRDRVSELTKLQVNVNLDCGIGVDPYSALQKRSESRMADVDVVSVNVERWKTIEPLCVRDRRAPHARRAASDGDRNAWHHCATGICNRSGYRPSNARSCNDCGQ